MCKMLANAFLLILPAVVYGGISVDLVIPPKLSDSKVSPGGLVYQNLPDEEWTVWGLTNRKLKEFMWKYRKGKHVNFCWVKHTGPGGPPMARTVVPGSAKVLNIQTDPHIVYTKLTDIFPNNRPLDEITFIPSVYLNDVVKTVSISNSTFSSKWTKNGDIKISDTVSYSVSLLRIDGTKTSHIVYKSEWGEDTTQSKTISINPSSKKSAPVKYRYSDELVASVVLERVTIDVQVNYTTSLTGSFKCRYTTYQSSPFGHNRRTRAKKVPHTNYLYEEINRIPRDVWPFPTFHSTENIRIIFIHNMLQLTSETTVNYQNISVNFTYN